MVIGNPAMLGFEIGPYWNQSKQHQTLKIWIDGKLLSQIDSVVYLPSFCSALERDLEKLRKFDFFAVSSQIDDQLFEFLEEDASDRFRVLRYDLTCSMADCFFVNNYEGGAILYAFWDSRYNPKEDLHKVFKLNISKDDLMGILLSVSDALSRNWI